MVRRSSSLALILKDNAALWFKYVCEEAEAQGVQLTWEGVQEKLLQRFRPIESGKTARVALASLRQTGSALSIIAIYSSNMLC